MRRLVTSRKLASSPPHWLFATAIRSSNTALNAATGPSPEAADGSFEDVTSAAVLCSAALHNDWQFSGLDCAMGSLELKQK